MSAFAQWLRRYPVLFDLLNRLNRRWRHTSSIYSELIKHLPVGSSFTFLQIGANDGVSKDPFREFMIRREARRVAAEPVPEYFASLCRNYCQYSHVIPENSAIGYPAGQLPFYAYAPEYLATRKDSMELTMLASFTRDKLLSSLKPNESADACIQEIIIPVCTVEQVMERYGFKQFDCLFIDCEGHEENIICQLDFDRVKPRLIVFEHTHQGERNKVIEARLTEQGFTFVHLTHDTIASRRL